MNRLYPAETRLKEGAHAHDSNQTGGSLPLPRVGGALSARSRQYQGTAASMSNAAQLERSVTIGNEQSPSVCRSRARKVADHCGVTEDLSGEPHFRELEPDGGLAAGGGLAQARCLRAGLFMRSGHEGRAAGIGRRSSLLYGGSARRLGASSCRGPGAARSATKPAVPA